MNESTNCGDSYENRIPNQLKLTMTFYFHSRWRIKIHDLLCQNSEESAVATGQLKPSEFAGREGGSR